MNPASTHCGQRRGKWSSKWSSISLSDPICSLQNTHLLSTVLSGSRGEHGDKLAVEGSAGPELSAGIEEGRDLGGDSSVSGRSADNQTVDLLEVVGGDDGVLGLEGRSGVHLGEDLLGKGLLAGRLVAARADREQEGEGARGRVTAHRRHWQRAPCQPPMHLP